jgi:arginyl-tRNA synthetase
MDIRSTLSEIVAAAVGECFPGLVPDADARKAALVEMPRDIAHGDLATSVCLKLARALKMAPLAAAKILGGPVKSACDERIPGYVDTVEIVAPGFMNFHLGIGYLRGIVNDIAAGGYGRSNIGAGTRFNVEFVSANPTGPLTVAHGRQAAVGDSLCRILRHAGFDVTREYYLNDTGRQIRLLGASAFHFYAEAAGSSYPFPEDGYHGDYIPVLGRELYKAHGKALLPLPEAEAVEKAGIFVADRILEGIKADLAEFRAAFDVWFSQRAFESSGAVDELMKRLRARGVVFDQDGAAWLRASEFGDDKDRVLVKSDGSYTYRTPDIAYLESKFDRGFNRAVVTVGPDHHGHIITMQAAMRALGHPVEAFTGLIIQFCSLWRGKEKLKMSTRAAQFVTVREVFEEVGIDATRYFFTARKTDSPLDFDLELAKKQSMDNPVYYIQYMSARLSGVLGTAAGDARFAAGFKDGLYLPGGVDLAPLGAEEEPLLRMLLQLPVVIEKSAENLEPHRLCGYLYDLAGLFHNYYSKCRFVSDDEALSRARLYFASALKMLLIETLGLIGIAAPEKM